MVLSTGAGEGQTASFIVRFFFHLRSTVTIIKIWLLLDWQDANH